ncbi:MAG: chromosomal replication initiator protein DnaA [Clostridia bacterium]|nr:chromosomal replication initiator protein DnaA [Clostridia bacterium]
MAYIDDMTQVWHLVRESFRPELSDVITDLWLGGLEVVDFQGSTVTMKAESEVKIRVVTSKYKADIERRFSEMLGFEVKLSLVSESSPIIPPEDSDLIRRMNQTPSPEDLTPPADTYTDFPAEASPPQNSEEGMEHSNIGSTMPPFNFEYTFENFIVGSSNKFAHAACIAVADRPAQAYNPLFIYGPSGLGKTHLLYAITNELKKKIHNIRVIYIKGEDFTNQMIDSMSRQAMTEFRDKYRSCDVLLIDDIHFIAGKTSTQEEFFNTFNALHEAGKQIIMTSDRPPREIKTLEERLRTRFEWGLIADIQPPDLELRTAIIKKKAAVFNVSIPEDVLTFLAENLRSNIRQIEGAIKKLGAKSFLTGRLITMELARSCISELLGGAEPVTVTVDKIFAAVYKKYDIKKEDIVSSKRTKEIANARHITVYVIRQITDMSLPNIGKIIERDHSTVLSSLDAIEKRMVQNPVFRTEIEEMIKEIKGS